MPLTATALVFQPLNGAAERQVLVAVDHVLLWAREMETLLDAVSAGSGVARDQLVIAFSHTHAAGLMGLERVDLPGGDLIPDYLRELGEKLAVIVCEAAANLEPANITYATGQCALAQHRDFWDEASRQFVCGFNPDGPTDDTVMIARISKADGAPLASVVNYACHPTTLAWQNTRISPDFPGAMRALVERETGVPCVFLQGASGDLGPREGFTGDVAVAERNGRQLGHAVLAAWESLPPPATRFVYSGPVVSGATIGTWAHEALSAEEVANLSRWQQWHGNVAVPYRSDLPSRAETQRELHNWRDKERQALLQSDTQTARDCRAMVERMTRRLGRLENLPAGNAFPLPIQIWRIGAGMWVAVEAELYHWFQKELRRRCPGVPVFVITLANGSRPSYLPTAEAYGKGIYQESIAVLAPGALVTLLDAVCDKIHTVT